MKVVVITGSRDWTDRAAIERVLVSADAVIVGDCPDQRTDVERKHGAPMRSADAIALQIAREWDVVFTVLVADWYPFGKYDPGAGPRRNARIVADAREARAAGLDVECHAFPLPGSKGTLDCTRQLRGAGFEVKNHGYGGDLVESQVAMRWR